MRVNALLASLHAALLVATLDVAARAQQPGVPLESTPSFGFQTLVEGAPSRAGFPDRYGCPEIRKHVPGRPSNEWTSENLPEGCREAIVRADATEPRTRFELRTYFDIGTVGWDNNYSTAIPSIGGIHVSFANLGGWKLGAGGLLVSFSPMFDLQTQTRRYQISPRVNLFNVNRRVTELAATGYDVYFSVEATREMFLPAESAERTVDGSAGFNNVFFGVAFSRRAK